LDISRNEIKFLPNSIGKMRKLKYLWLEDNKLYELPESIFIPNSLKFIVLRGNPLKNLDDIKKSY
jgi:Leucine-rich repeat (LRR) protein